MSLIPLVQGKGLPHFACDLMTFYSLRLPSHKIMQTSEENFLSSYPKPRAWEPTVRSGEALRRNDPDAGAHICWMLYASGQEQICPHRCALAFSGRITSRASSQFLQAEPTRLIPTAVFSQLRLSGTFTPRQARTQQAASLPTTPLAFLHCSDGDRISLS